MHEALRRELTEETGLLVGDPVRTAFLMHIDSEPYPSALAAAFEIDEWSGTIAPQDDDINQAAFFPLPDALKLLGRLDSATQREPLVGYLTGDVAPGTIWLYRNRARTRRSCWCPRQGNAYRWFTVGANAHFWPRLSQWAMSPMTAGSTCCGIPYSAGVDGPAPGKNRWLSAS